MKPSFDLTNSCYNILFCGIGGQGVLTASEVTALAAMMAGQRVKKSEVHGMSQRGGSVESHVRFGRDVNAPLIEPGKADFLVCLHEDEGKRLGFFLRKEGVSFLPLLAEAAKKTDARGINVYILGMLAAMLPIKTEIWLDALKTVIKKRVDENRATFLAGVEAGRAAT